MSVDFIYTNLTVYGKSTPNDVVILANASGVTDAGRIANMYPNRYDTYGSGSTAQSFQALNMTGNDVILVIGGDYSDDSGNPYNLFYQTVNARYASAGVRLSGDATIYFAAQTGAALASANSDADLRFGVSARTSYARGAVYNSDTPGVIDASAIVFDAGSNALTVGGDVSGRFEASAAVGLYGISTVSGTTVTPINLSVDNVVVATAFAAGTLVIGNNFAGDMQLDASGSEIAAYAGLTVTGNTLGAVAIAAEAAVECENGQWEGSIVCAANDNLLSAAVSDLAESITTFTPGTVTGNTIKAVGVSAGESIAIAAMIGGAIDTAASGNIIIGEADGGTSSGVLTFTGNTILAAALSASDVRIDETDAEVLLTSTASDNAMELSVRGSGNSLSFSDNTIAAVGISAAAVTLGRFAGAITAESSGNSLSFSGSWSSTSGNYVVSAAGISATGSITVADELSGVISVTMDGNQCSGGYFTNSGALLLAGYGMTAAGIAVNGQFNGDFTVTLSDNSGFAIAIAYGLKAETITAGAFAGTIAVSSGSGLAIGIQVSDRLISVYDGDAFDINGAITSDHYGILSMNALNLRISGTVTAALAVATECYYDEASATLFYSTDNDADQLELSDTARINGAIDLGAGVNSLTIASGAMVNGNLLASEGELNLTFALDSENADGGYAIVNTDLNDISLVSTASTLTINLNAAETDSVYRLFQYSGDACGYWSSKNITFICQGETLSVTLVDGSAGVIFNGVTVTVTYDQDDNSVNVVTGSGSNATIGDLPAFGTVAGELSAGGDLALSWDSVTLGGTAAEEYEIEYRILDASGEYAGQSVAVTVAGGTLEYTLSALALNSGETVEYRVRGISGDGAYVSQWSSLDSSTMATADPGVNENFYMIPESGSIVSPGNASGGITSSTVAFSWADAVSDQALDYYVVLYVESEDELEIVSWQYDPERGIFQATDASGNTYDADYKLAAGTQAIASKLTNQRYVYWAVEAVDVSGNQSGFIDGQTFRVWTGDNTAPVFPSGSGNYVSLAVNSEDAYNITYDVTFQWPQATDLQSGVYQYIVEYSTDQEDWTRIVCDNDTYSTAVSGLAGGLYCYRICAVDYVGNQSAYLTESSFGSTDTTPPDGQFLTLAAAVSAEYTESTATDSSGNETTTKTYTSITVDFSWTDDFTDDSSLVYTIEICGDGYFTGDVYRFTTTDQAFVLASGETGATVAILAGMGTVYWRLAVADAAGNTNPAYSQTYSFQMLDDEGDRIPISGAVSRPEDLTAEVDGSAVTFSWTDATALGTYRFRLTYTVNGITYAIDDIADVSCTVSGLADGIYSWKVTAISGSGSAAAATGTAFLVDDIAPEKVTMKQIVNHKNDVIFTWETSADAVSGTAYYVLKYKSVNATTFTTVTVTDTAYIAAFTANGNYQYLIYAVDAAGNASESVSGVFIVDASTDLGDNFATATAIASGETVATQTLGMGDTTDMAFFTVAANSDVVLALDNFTDLIGKSSGMTVKIYASDQKTVLKTFSVKANATASDLAFFVTAGSYYIQLSARSTKAISSYDLTLETTVVHPDNSDDTPSTARALTFVGNVAVTGDDWVGYGDAVDYYSFAVDAAGEGDYIFSLSDYTAGNVVLTVCRSVDGALKKVGSFTATAGKSELMVSNLLSGEYYVAVSSPNTKTMQSTKNSNYDLAVIADQFQQLTAGETAMLDRNEYAVFIAPEEYQGEPVENLVLAISGGKYAVYRDDGSGQLKQISVSKGAFLGTAGTSYYIKSSAADNALAVNVVQAYGDGEDGSTLAFAAVQNTNQLSAAVSGWCGGSDAEDAIYFTLGADTANGWGSFLMTLDSTLGNTAKLKVTLYEYVGSAWQAVENVKVTSKASSVLFGSSLAEGQYKLVISGGSDKNAAAYTLTGTVDLYTSDDGSWEGATILTGDGTTTGTVVRNVDATDIYDVSDLAEGKLGLTQNSGSAKITFFDSEGNEVKVTLELTGANGKVSTRTGSSFTLKSTATASLLLELTGTDAAYVKIEAAGSGNNQYTLAVEDSLAVTESVPTSASAIDLSWDVAAGSESLTAVSDSMDSMLADISAGTLSYGVSTADSTTTLVDSTVAAAENTLLKTAGLLA